MDIEKIVKDAVNEAMKPFIEEMMAKLDELAERPVPIELSINGSEGESKKEKPEKEEAKGPNPREAAISKLINGY